MKAKVTAVQRLKWRQLAYPMHYVGRHKCTFRLATMLERKIVVSSIGEYRPDLERGDVTMAGLGGALSEAEERYYETYVFRIESFANDGVPIIGKQLDSTRCRTAGEAYKAHEEMCVKFQLELNMGMHR